MILADLNTGEVKIVENRKHTKASVLAAARKRWGKAVQLEECKGALSPEQRAQVRARQKEIRDRLESIKAQRDALYPAWKDWAKVARFFFDVNGDEPSSSQLRAAVAAKEQEDDLAEEKKSLEAERSHNVTAGYRQRYRLLKIHGSPFPHASVEAEADTLDELAAKVERND